MQQVASEVFRMVSSLQPIVSELPQIPIAAFADSIGNVSEGIAPSADKLRTSSDAIRASADGVRRSLYAIARTRDTVKTPAASAGSGTYRWHRLIIPLNRFTNSRIFYFSRIRLYNRPASLYSISVSKTFYPYQTNPLLFFYFITINPPFYEARLRHALR